MPDLFDCRTPFLPFAVVFLHDRRTFIAAGFWRPHASPNIEFRLRSVRDCGSNQEHAAEQPPDNISFFVNANNFQAAEPTVVGIAIEFVEFDNAFARPVNGSSGAVVPTTFESELDSGQSRSVGIDFSKNTPNDFLSKIDLSPVPGGWSGKFAVLRTFLEEDLLATRAELRVTVVRPTVEEVLDALIALV